MKNFNYYESPTIEVMGVEVEKGFALSGDVIGSLEPGEIEWEFE